MAKIDSVGRMLLPPDPGIKTQAYSARERAVSEPVMRALADWFQTVQQGRRDATDESLLNAVRGILTDKVRAGEPSPRAILAQVIVALPPSEVKNAKPEQFFYLAHVGQESMVVASKTQLEPGQALILTPGKGHPQLMLPQTVAQARLILSLVQHQQMVHLPTPQSHTPLTVGTGQLFGIPVHLTSSNSVPFGTAFGATTGAAATAHTDLNFSSATASATPALGTTTSTTPTLHQTLSTVLSQWLSALPQATANQSVAAPNTSFVASGARPLTSDGGAPPPGAPTVTGHHLQLSNHWIPQLIQAARAEYGNATPQTVRQVWQQWQGQMQQQLQTPASIGKGTPSHSGANASDPHPTAANTPAATATSSASTRPSSAGVVFTPAAALLNTATHAPSVPVGPAVQLPPSAGPAVLGEWAPVLGNGGSATGQNTTFTTERTSPVAQQDATPSRNTAGRIPTDLWRLVAEQLVDTRLQQLGQQTPSSLQTQLQSRAQLIRNQPTMTYSPQQLKQLLQTPAGPPALTPASPSPEQQNLVQLRQLLEQVTQQQQARTVAPAGQEPSTEPPRLTQGFPVLADQHLVWFDLERQPDSQQSGETPPAARTWVLDLHFHLSPMAPICARLRWQGDHGDIEFLTDDMPTLRALHNNTQNLQAQLHKQGLPIDDIQCRHGLPKRVNTSDTPGDEAPDAGGKIDVHT